MLKNGNAMIFQFGLNSALHCYSIFFFFLILTNRNRITYCFADCWLFSWQKRQIFSQNLGLFHENTLFSTVCLSLQFIQLMGGSWIKLSGSHLGMIFLFFSTFKNEFKYLYLYSNHNSLSWVQYEERKKNGLQNFFLSQFLSCHSW